MILTIQKGGNLMPPISIVEKANIKISLKKFCVSQKNFSERGETDVNANG